MRVLEDDDYGLLPRQTFELADQRLQNPLLLALRAKVRQWIMLRSRQRQQVGEQCHVLIRWCGAGQQGVELLQPRSRRIVAREPGCPGELVDERIERAVLVI